MPTFRLADWFNASFFPRDVNDAANGPRDLVSQ
jgi:hypothetical protein